MMPFPPRRVRRYSSISVRLPNPFSETARSVAPASTRSSATTSSPSSRRIPRTARFGAAAPRGGQPRMRELVHLQPVALAARREEQEVAVRRGDEQVLDEVLLARRRPDLATTAAALRPVEAHGVPLDVALVRDGDDHVLFDDEVLDGEHPHLVDDLGAPRVGVLLADRAQLLDDDPRYLALVGQDLPIALDRALGLPVFLEDLVALEAGEALEAHVENGLGLDLGETERRHQAGACGGRIRSAANEGDRLVEVLDRDLEAGEDVQPLLRLA